MAPSATSTQSFSSKIKRPVPPGIQTNGIKSSALSTSPSMFASRLPSAAKFPPNPTTNNALGSSTSGPRSANRTRREPPAQLLGRGQRNSSVGLRSGSIAGDNMAVHSAGPQPYVKTDEYILKKYRGNTPSLVVHLHPTHFKFDEQEGSFTYKSPMKIVIEHLRQRTIPHDLVEFMDVPFYEGCMIVQIYDHKSITPSEDSTQSEAATGKKVLDTIHTFNKFLTPSSYAPYPTENVFHADKGKRPTDGISDKSSKSKTAEQMDKENMPAPAVPGDSQRSKHGALPSKPKISTIILHPTPLSDHAEFVQKAAEATSSNEGRRDSRQDAGPISATLPPTPSTAVPSTPITSMAPPTKRQKKGKVELDSTNIYAAESKITLATTASLILDPVNSASESAALLKALSHPMHTERPPSTKTRKRTVAEMAADEALAAEQERYMLILDERLSSNAAGVAGANPADGDGQAGGASFEPRFERFKVLENIKNNHEENKRTEKLRREESDRKLAQDRERDRLRQEAEKREQDKLRNSMAMQQQQAAARQQQQQEASRRAQLAAQAQQQQGLQGIPPQVQHAHPQANVLMANGMQGQPQRFHQQQVSQTQASSPIVRNGTPQTHSSPMTAGGIGNVPMQHSTSSMGGSPARPGSVVQQNHPPMGAPTPHNMTAQRSQQSHSGTPRMPISTPNMQPTALNRQISQTPRMSQASPLQGQMAQVPQISMLPNGQPMQLNQAQQQFATQRLNMMRQQQGQAIGGMINGQQVSPQQMLQAQQHMLRQQQQQQQLQQQQQQQGMPNNMNQNYAAQMAAMAARTGVQPNANQNFGNQQNMQQMQQMRVHQLHQQAQVQAQQQQQPQQISPQQAAYQNQIMRSAQHIYNRELQNLQARCGGNVPEELDRQLKATAQQNARQLVDAQIRARRNLTMQQQQQQQAAMMAAQQGGMQQQNITGMQNGMGM